MTRSEKKALVACALTIVGLLAAAPLAGAAASWDSAQWDSAQWDGTHWDGAQWDGSQWDSAQWDTARWDAAQWDSAQWDSAQWDAAHWDGFGGFDPLYAYQWNLRALGVPGAWAAFGPGDGSKTVCVIDSGVDDSHPDLGSQMWTDPKTGAHGYDFVDHDDFPMDVGGHGTHVASILAARSGDGYGIAGVVNAKIMAVRVLGPDGTGADADLAAGMKWCVDHGASVLSLSVSLDDKSKVVADAAKDAVARGALIVASAGNGGCKCAGSTLTKVDGVLTVTAMAPDGTLASFANYGPSVDFGAPGVLVPGDLPGGKFALGSGTSQAVPQVAGLAALMWEANPHLTTKDIAQIIKKTSIRMGSPSPVTIRVPDAQAAMNAALAAK
ncbi:MAG: S8 family serine peptidase [Candidatus Thermoplasmatota archaeon]